MRHYLSKQRRTSRKVIRKSLLVRNGQSKVHADLSQILRFKSWKEDGKSAWIRTKESMLGILGRVMSS